MNVPTHDHVEADYILALLDYGPKTTEAETDDWAHSPKPPHFSEFIAAVMLAYARDWIDWWSVTEGDSDAGPDVEYHTTARGERALSAFRRRQHHAS